MIADFGFGDSGALKLEVDFGLAVAASEEGSVHLGDDIGAANDDAFEGDESVDLSVVDVSEGVCFG